MERMQKHHLLYAPLLAAGIRLLRKRPPRCPAHLSDLTYVQIMSAHKTLTVHGPAYSPLCVFHNLLNEILTHEIIQLTLLESPFQKDFISAPDVPWPSADVATVRSVGRGAGNMTYILLRGAGHFVSCLLFPVASTDR